MVDLGFLLITFFIFTSVILQPTLTKLLLPKDSKVKTLLKDNAVLTLMLTRNNSIEYYEGAGKKEGINHFCNFKALRNIIQQKQKKVASILGDRSETVIIISPEEESTYKNFMDVFDEIQINDISHYFVINSNK